MLFLLIIYFNYTLTFLCNMPKQHTLTAILFKGKNRMHETEFTVAIILCTLGLNYKCS